MFVCYQPREYKIADARTVSFVLYNAQITNITRVVFTRRRTLAYGEIDIKRNRNEITNRSIFILYDNYNVAFVYFMYTFFYEVAKDIILHERTI